MPPPPNQVGGQFGSQTEASVFALMAQESQSEEAADLNREQTKGKYGHGLAILT